MPKHDLRLDNLDYIMKNMTGFMCNPLDPNAPPPTEEELREFAKIAQKQLIEESEYVNHPHTMKKLLKDYTKHQKTPV